MDEMNQLFQDPFGIDSSRKNELLLPILKDQVVSAVEKNIHIKSMYKKLSINPREIKSLHDIPVIPVTMFKHLDLATCASTEIIRFIQSSSTTGQTPSRVPIDKITSQRQSRALIAILSEFLGKKRRPFLVIDVPTINEAGENITARGAAVRGISNFASSIDYTLIEDSGKLHVDIEKVKNFAEQHAGENILVFGFTYLLWTIFVEEMQALGLQLDFPGAIILHSGGWKKLSAMSVSKDQFSSTVAHIFSTDPSQVLDFYGMAEQTGIIFVDCAAGNKHAPSFSEVVIRDYSTFQPVQNGNEGLIEIISCLPTSFYGQAILTEDIGVMGGVDTCPCGRKGTYFRFKSRVEKVEIRGCGDTFATRQERKGRT
jgi:phenylacetate-coenzyme A ligase PaaK-like adenylate-forming protein